MATAAPSQDVSRDSPGAVSYMARSEQGDCITNEWTAAAILERARDSTKWTPDKAPRALPKPTISLKDRRIHAVSDGGGSRIQKDMQAAPRSIPRTTP